MTNRTIDERLSRLIQASFNPSLERGYQPYLENRIFTNRNIKLSRIQAIGFDMDYTLAQYRSAELDEHLMSLVLRILVDKNGYPESILSLPYDSDFAIRGLVMDTELGNVLKMDKFRYVSLAYHGLKPLETHNRAELYNTSRISFNGGRYRSVDTLFELLETYLLAALVEYLDANQPGVRDYATLYREIRAAIDVCHRDGSLKKEIMAHPEKYIKDDPLLVPALHKFIESGKRLFVLTNSEPEYTDFVLSYLFRNSWPFFRSWRNCFDIVGTSAKKPLFFKEGSECQVIEEKDALLFSGGNIDFLEERLGIKGEQVLYVGDHIYGDILKSKHETHWRTCIIVPELEFQIRAEQESKPFLQELVKNENRRKELSMELNWRRSLVQDLHQFKLAESDELEPRHLELIDRQIEKLNRQLESNHQELSSLLFESRQLRRRISNTFNCYWGRLFKTGGQLSAFAEQVRHYACIYTSAVSNFNFYGSHCYFESSVTPMPHEKNLYSLGDLNFDISMEAESTLADEVGHPLALPLPIEVDPLTESIPEFKKAGLMNSPSEVSLKGIKI